MPIDFKRIEEFVAGREKREILASVVRRSGFEVVWVVEISGREWGFYLKLNRHLREILGTGREVLVWVAEWDEFQARTVMNATDCIARERPRLCDDFALIVTADPRTSANVDETSSTLQTMFLGFSFDEIKRCQPYGPNIFLSALQGRFFSKDLYQLSLAIKSPANFFGRRQLIADLSALLRSTGSHVALFGLRRMGKTSVLYRILDYLKSSGNYFAAHMDIQVIDSVRPSAAYFFWSLGEQLADLNPRIRRIKGLRCFGKCRSFSVFLHLI